MNILDLFRKADTVSVDEAQKMLKSKNADEVALLDVRQPEEYERGHIPGSQFIPLADILKRIEEIDKSKTIVTYCARGRRSGSAAILLKSQGFENVLSLEGGIEAWNGSTAKGQYEQGLYLLDGRELIEELIPLAWSLEEGSRTFYERVSSQVKDEESKKIFENLIAAEDKHKKMLFRALEQIKGKKSAEEIFSRETLRGAMEGGVSVDSALAWIEEEGSKVDDIIEMSMQIEVNSLDLYTKMRNYLKNDDARHMFDTLLEEEKSHLSWFGKLIGNRMRQHVTKA